MNKTLYISGIVVTFCMLAMGILPYFEGLDFNKNWLRPMVILPVGLLCLLVFSISALACIFGVLRKQRHPRNLLIILFLPAVILLLYFIRFPGYVDGMHRTMSSQISSEELTAFATDAEFYANTYMDMTDPERKEIIEELKEKHSKALSFSALKPRMHISDEYVNVYYGGALTKHWGYLVTEMETFPINHIPKSMTKKLYKGVWVYHDIW